MAGAEGLQAPAGLNQQSGRAHGCRLAPWAAALRRARSALAHRLLPPRSQPATPPRRSCHTHDPQPAEGRAATVARLPSAEQRCRHPGARAAAAATQAASRAGLCCRPAGGCGTAALEKRGQRGQQCRRRRWAAQLTSGAPSLGSGGGARLSGGGCTPCRPAGIGMGGREMGRK